MRGCIGGGETVEVESRGPREVRRRFETSGCERGSYERLAVPGKLMERERVE